MDGVGRVACQGWGSLHQCSGGWGWISSLWSTMKHPIVSSEISIGLV